jgi:transglutaminase-like putative cysteine protease
MDYAVTHTTTYHYSDPVSLCHNLVHLHPREAPRQVCHHSQLMVQPEPRAVHAYRDYYGNPVAHFTIEEPHKTLEITAKHRIEVTGEPSRVSGRLMTWESARDTLRLDRTAVVLDACMYTFDSPYIIRNDALAAYASPSFAPGRPFVDAVADLTARIHREFHYDADATTVATPLDEVLELRHGVCQDFAHLAIGCLRSLGLAARYVSGYLETQVQPGCERLVGADASHAWISVFCPESGWLDFDPTNNLIPSDRHLTLAWGRDYDDVSPIKGVILGGGTHTMTIAVDVQPLAG